MAKSVKQTQLPSVDRLIHIICGRKIMPDSDLAQWCSAQTVRSRSPLSTHSEEHYSFSRRSRSAFIITENELNVMAALAIMGLRSRPKNG